MEGLKEPVGTMRRCSVLVQGMSMTSCGAEKRSPWDHGEKFLSKSTCEVVSFSCLIRWGYLYQHSEISNSPL